MLIHNFYNDLLLSMITLNENYLFASNPGFFINNNIQKKPKSFIQRYEFNIASRVHTIGDYRDAATFEFPTSIISLGSSDLIFPGQSAGMIGHHAIEVINEVPVLYDNETRNTLYLREEQKAIQIAQQINCESQLHAKEIESIIKSFLPVNKYVQFLEFTSFLEIPLGFLDSNDMNPHHHDISNIFQRVDLTTGDAIFCFAIHYKPFIRLNSCTSDVSDMTARSFPVICDYIYVIQEPVWLFTEFYPKEPERINISFTMPNVPISDIILTYGTPLRINDINYKIKRNYIVGPDDECIENIEDTVGGKRIKIIKPVQDLKFEEAPVKINKGSKSLVLHPNVLPETVTEVTFEYNETNNFVLLIFPNISIWEVWKPELTSPLIIQFLTSDNDL